MVFPVGYLRIGKGLIEREYGTKAGTVLPILWEQGEVAVILNENLLQMFSPIPSLASIVWSVSSWKASVKELPVYVHLVSNVDLEALGKDWSTVYCVWRWLGEKDILASERGYIQPEMWFGVLYGAILHHQTMLPAAVVVSPPLCMLLIHYSFSSYQQTQVCMPYGSSQKVRL